MCLLSSSNLHAGSTSVNVTNVNAEIKSNLECSGEHQQIPEQDALEPYHPSLACAQSYSLIHRSSCSQDNLRLHQQGPLTKVVLGLQPLLGLGIQQEEPAPENIKLSINLSSRQGQWEKKIHDLTIIRVHD